MSTNELTTLPEAVVIRGGHGSRTAALVSGSILGILSLIALVGPLIAPHDPNSVDLSRALQLPSSQYWLGTDASGRDILSRLLAGARLSLSGPLFVSVIATTFGALLAITGAWKKGWFDQVLGTAVNTTFSFPGLLSAILAVAVFGPGFIAPVIALAIANLPYVTRVIRSIALRECAMPYVAVCEINGFSGWRICWKHLLPNLIEPIAVQGALTFSYAMVDLAAINFLGLGVQPPQSEWGVMIATGQSSILRGFPEESLFASALIVLSVVSMNILADSLAGRHRS